MPVLTRAVPALLLALAACSRAPGSDNHAEGRGEVADNNMLTAGSPAPSPVEGSMNAMNPTSAPPERFIVCPGNPRCPPGSGQPGAR